MIRVEGVGHRFGSLRVLHDVWFHVPEGEVFGFIGPNGAGKTTTLRMMATLLEPDEGRVLLDGVDVVDDPAAVRRLLGFMPDSFGVYERVTVIEYLDFFAAAYDIERSARPRTVQAVMELTDLGPLRDRLVAAMSKGMKQRLAIARTLLHDPKVLILDEPANGLDPRARIEMRDLILQLRDLGKTVLLSSHILTELSDMVSSVAILEKGRVLAAGKVDEIRKNLRPERTLRMTLLRPPVDLNAPFAEMPSVHEVSLSPDGALRLSFEGGDEVVAELVARCVPYGVVRVEPERDDLERIFLEVTKGELQ
ncbi:MAG: ABC transporter ATP-binding protein [Deltaproteobacteria bacterium]|nr:ABC transporter ATP-binding protein [Deltaproteobacteria bacterium]